MINVVAAIIFKDGKVLIAKRKPEKSLGGFWEFPGGKIEEGEAPETTAIREIKEELGIQISVDRYLSESVYQYDFGTINLKGYICKFMSGEMSLNDHSEVKWVNIDELKLYKMAPADVKLTECLI